MARYVARPVEVEAFQYDGPEGLFAAEEAPPLPEGLVWKRDHYGGRHVEVLRCRSYWTSRVCRGDWVVTYPDGTRDVMKPTLFRKTFRAVKPAKPTGA